MKSKIYTVLIILGFAYGTSNPYYDYSYKENNIQKETNLSCSSNSQNPKPKIITSTNSGEQNSSITNTAVISETQHGILNSRVKLEKVGFSPAEGAEVKGKEEQTEQLDNVQIAEDDCNTAVFQESRDPERLEFNYDTSKTDWKDIFVYKRDISSHNLESIVLRSLTLLLDFNLDPLKKYFSRPRDMKYQILKLSELMKTHKFRIFDKKEDYEDAQLQMIELFISNYIYSQRHKIHCKNTEKSSAFCYLLSLRNINDDSKIRLVPWLMFFKNSDTFSLLFLMCDSKDENVFGLCEVTPYDKYEDEQMNS